MDISLSPWNQVTIPHGNTYMWHIGPLKFWVHRNHEEWDIAWEGEQKRLGSTVAKKVVHPIKKNSDKTEQVEWTQYVAGKDDTIAIKPQLPVSSVVIRPAQPLKILPGKGAQFYFYIPIWIRLITGSGKSKTILTEIPTIILSRTWFGAPDTGELAFSLDIAMQKECFNNSGIHFALCPVYIKNSSNVILDFQRLCLRVEHLSLYYGEEGLSTNEVVVSYRGVEQSSQITFLKSSPKNLKQAILVSEPRVPANKNLIKKSFHYLKALVDY